MVKKGRGRHFSPKLRGSEIWFKHVPDTVPTSNVDQFLSLMAEIVPLDVNSNFGFMVECSRITLDGRKWAGKRFFSQDSMLVGSSKTLIHVQDTVPTSNSGQISCLMAQNFPLDVDSNFVLMLEHSLTPLSGQKRQGKAFFPQTQGL